MCGTALNLFCRTTKIPVGPVGTGVRISNRQTALSFNLLATCPERSQLVVCVAYDRSKEFRERASLPSFAE
eukprot:2229737-Prymnesium_polylepis.1